MQTWEVSSKWSDLVIDTFYLRNACEMFDFLFEKLC